MVYDGGAYEVTISIHAPRTGSDDARFHALAHVHISIHAPRTGSDEIFVENQAGIKHFNPRSPHGERPSRTHFCPLVVQFQSTLPARGATRRQSAVSCFKSISIHAPRTGSDGITPPFGQAPFISIHAPRTGSDNRTSFGDSPIWYFNPRSPHGERPAASNDCHADKEISIHAPRTGSDPRGGDERGGGMAFQSTLPARGATGLGLSGFLLAKNFNPRSPHGERRPHCGQTFEP